MVCAKLFGKHGGVLVLLWAGFLGWWLGDAAVDLVIGFWGERRGFGEWDSVVGSGDDGSWRLHERQLGGFNL